METVLKSFNSWKHKRGFGIHSPFAYRFVTEVLCQRWHYYAYIILGRDENLRLIHRLAVDFQPEKFYIVASDKNKWAKPITMATSKAMPTDTPKAGTLLVAEWPYMTHRTIKALKAGANAMIMNASDDALERIAAVLKHGMCFYNNHGTIVVANLDHLPRQDFNVNF